jgi:hypothetical protein
MINIVNEKTQHHIWCNYWGTPREGCKQCEYLYKDYPIDKNLTMEEMTTKYFPNVKVIK